MASQQTPELDGSHDPSGLALEEQHHFEKQPPEDYFCPVSLEIMLEPHQTTCCGNHLSSKMAEVLKRDKKPCPMCKTPAMDTHDDLYFKRKILCDVKVYCPYKKNGCEWIGTLKGSEEHSNSCAKRFWECPFCGLETSFNKGRSEHLPYCSKQPKCCPNNCGISSVPMCDLDLHLECCPLQEVECKYSHAGCEQRILCKDLPQHLKENVQQHHLLVSELNLKLTQDLHQKLEVEMREKDQLVDEMKQQLANKDLEVRELQQELSVGMSNETERKLFSIVQDLRLKQSLNESELSNLIAEIQAVLLNSNVPVISDDSLSSEPFGVSFITSEVYDLVDETDSLLCGGKFMKVVMEGLSKAFGIAVSNGKLFAVDNYGYNGVHIINADGTGKTKTIVKSASMIKVLDIPGTSSAKCWYPRGIAINHEGNVLLADTGSHRVLKFTQQGSFLGMVGTYGKCGNRDNQFHTPIGVGVDRDGKVYVCDCDNHRIQVFNSDLTFLTSFGKEGRGPREFCHPWGVAFDSKGNIYVADCSNSCIKIFKPDYQPLHQIGHGRGEKKLRAPVGICIDANDYIYVTDKILQCVLVFTPDWKFKMHFGKFFQPYGIAIDSSGRVYVSDNSKFTLNGRVQVFQ